MALRLLQACRRVCRAEGQTTLTLHHLRTACELERLDELGLGPTERKYLLALAEGATRLNVLASMLALPARTLSAVIEPFLLRAGLIYKDDDGRRQMTALGKDHAMKSCPESVQLPSK